MVDSAPLTGTARLLDRLLSRYLRHGSLHLTYPSGAMRTYGRAENGQQTVEAVITQLPVARLRNPALFVGEAYMDGNLQIAENQLDGFFRLLAHNPTDSSALVRWFRNLPRRQANRRSRQRQQISHHYDLGNEYYKLWLDASLTYSCAYFKQPTDSLETAQRQKVELLLRKLQLKPGQKLLDIGCGWGTLAITAAKQYGVQVLGITLSHEQLAGAADAARQAGVADNVRFELANYQDLSAAATGQFDRIISVGMFEHVGRGNHAVYFQKVRELLKSDGLSVLHSITERLDKKVSPWIDKYIFPGGYLPTVDLVEALLARYGFWSIDRENLWQHYARTLDEWRSRHRAHRAEIIKMYDEVFYRQQDFWLAGSAAAFRYGDTGINQIIFTKHKPQYASWPWTRQYMLD